MRKSKPILFSPAMVQAIFDGRKNQTRRVLKSTTEHEGPYNSAYIEAHIKHVGWKEICPHGKIGDLLWVRETHYRFGHWRPVPGVKTKTGKQKWCFIADTEEVRFSDDPPPIFRISRHPVDHASPAWHKRLARFMPRSLCRLQLEIKDIRIEALQDISEADAQNEGPPEYLSSSSALVCYSSSGSMAHKVVEIEQDEYWRDNFRQLWDSINGSGSWSVNPWVWVLDFKVAK